MFTDRELANLINSKVPTVSSWRRRANIPKKKSSFPGKQRIQEYAKTHTASETATHFNRSEITARTWKKKYNIKFRPAPRPKSKYNNFPNKHKLITLLFDLYNINEITAELNVSKFWTENSLKAYTNNIFPGDLRRTFQNRHKNIFKKHPRVQEKYHKRFLEQLHEIRVEKLGVDYNSKYIFTRHITKDI